MVFIADFTDEKLEEFRKDADHDYKDDRCNDLHGRLSAEMVALRAKAGGDNWNFAFCIRSKKTFWLLFDDDS